MYLRFWPVFTQYSSSNAVFASREALRYRFLMVFKYSLREAMVIIHVTLIVFAY